MAVRFVKNLLSAVFKTGSASLLSIFFSIITNKIIAVLLGPIGYSIISIFKQLQQMFLGFATFGGKTAIIEGISKKAEMVERQHYQSIVTLTIGCLTMLTTVIVILLSPFLLKIYFSEYQSFNISDIKLLIIPIAANMLYFLVSSILNGYKEIGRLAILTIVVSLVSAVIVYPICMYYEDSKATVIILFLTIPNLIAFMIGIAFLKQQTKTRLFSFTRLDLAKSKQYFLHFIKFSAAMAVVGFLLNFYISFIQALISKKIGLEYVGFFMVAWTFSPRYLNILLNSFGTYYLPSLAEEKSILKRNTLIYDVQKVAILSGMPLIVGMMLFQKDIVSLLYSSEFHPALNMISIMLLGDFLKITSWTLGMNLLANADAKVFMYKEICIQTVFVFGVYLSIAFDYDLTGMGLAYCVMYVMNLTFLFLYCKNKYAYKNDKLLTIHWIIAFIFILITSIMFPPNSDYSYLIKIFWGALACTLSLFALSRKERSFLFNAVKKNL